MYTVQRCSVVVLGICLYETSTISCSCNFLLPATLARKIAQPTKKPRSSLNYLILHVHGMHITELIHGTTILIAKSIQTSSVELKVAGILVI